MSDNWEEFSAAQDAVEKKVYHFYYEIIEPSVCHDLMMIKDDEGNILAGAGPKTWDELLQNPNLRRSRLRRVRQLKEVHRRAQEEKKKGMAQIIIHNIHEIRGKR